MDKKIITYREILVKDRPIGILVGVIALYVIYTIFWLTNFPNFFVILGIFLLVHVAEFLLYFSFKIIRGIKLVLEAEVIDESGDNSKQSIDTGRNIAPPE